MWNRQWLNASFFDDKLRKITIEDVIYNMHTHCHLRARTGVINQCLLQRRQGGISLRRFSQLYTIVSYT